MIRSRLGLKALVLSGLVLGLMAFASSAAQAETGANWKVNGADVGSLAPRFLIKEIENQSGSLFFKTAGGTEVEILCKKAEFDEGGVLIGNGGISLGRNLFKECVTLLNKVLSTKCKPKTSGKALGEILSEKATGLIVLDTVAGSTFDLVKITPDTGTTFADIQLGETCSIGELVAVTGELFIGDCNGNTSFLTEALTHLAQESLNKLLALGQPAKLIGSAIIGLEGAHQNVKWSGKPA
jgi:hypothetical protein